MRKYDYTKIFDNENGLNMRDKLLLTLFVAYRDEHNIAKAMSLADIMRLTGMCSMVIHRCVKSLTEKGLIGKIGKRAEPSRNYLKNSFMVNTRALKRPKKDLDKAQDKVL